MTHPTPRHPSTAAKPEKPVGTPSSGTPMVGPQADEIAENSKQQDPAGIGSAKEAAQDQPKGIPNSDRHGMNTAVAKHHD